ncbi:isoprenylcysteine carboxylmethyltransferase family protein [Roseomonas sp. AR75]|jgi:protein-S-isoprenylcysteine O-methyltransferase Ste14|uniref:methyltransferase family protein n=1 Tax=Roseomonas sp. AR75 TaxID=2562311 RepID=UPI0010C0E848|nr:isoprenylcysteine carboxylmethyltransferase family protein [Roseomonas sp. AR75]
MEQADRPNTVPWPPILYGAAALLAWLLGRVAPLPWPDSALLAPAGWMLIALGLGLDVWAMAVMARRRANILPHRAATALVTEGPFAWSRNPIYLGNATLLTGCALAFGNAWFLVAAAGAAAAVTVLAIRREEAHLALRFGAAWHAYAARTARWFGRRAGG